MLICRIAQKTSCRLGSSRRCNWQQDRKSPQSGINLMYPGCLKPRPLWAIDDKKFNLEAVSVVPVPLGLTPENLVKAEEYLFAAQEITGGLRLDRNSGLNKSKP